VRVKRTQPQRRAPSVVEGEATAVEVFLDIPIPTSCQGQNVEEAKSGDESSHQDRGVIAKSSVRTDMPVLINVKYNKLERT